jgi:hypothetical protein
METRFLQGKIDLASPPPPVSGAYYVRVALSGCSADSSGKCRSDMVAIPINPESRVSPASGWLQLWNGSPPQLGKWALSEDTYSGATDSPPGLHEFLVVARDRISGDMISQVVPFTVEAPLLAASNTEKTLCESAQTVIFSCKSGKRIISVCASPDVLRGKGHLGYRFGSVSPTIFAMNHGLNCLLCGGCNIWDCRLRRCETILRRNRLPERLLIRPLMAAYEILKGQFWVETRDLGGGRRPRSTYGVTVVFAED